MKSILYFFIFSLISFTSFAGNENPNGKTSINLENSKVEWKGYKVLGQHDGIVKFKSGSLVFEEGILIGGEFEVDMTSLVCNDLSGKGKENLERHLKSDDFFGVESHPVSTLKITKVTSRGKNGEYKITANLAIKKSVKEIKFNAVVMDGKGSASIKIDRSDFDIRYGSGSFFDNLGDKTIYDEFDLNIMLMY